MNKLEETIYTRGLEVIYRHALLGEEEQTLSCIEHLVYLTRKLSDSAPVKQPVAEEIALFKRICAACWPELDLQVRLEAGAELAQTERGQVSGQVCGALSEQALHGRRPDLLRLYLEDGRLCYGLSCGGVPCGQGAVGDE